VAVGDVAGSSRYDAFVSYSHAADGLLAPRLQAGLQRFAKPWWRRRAVRVFRDESSLSANPHLWSSIVEAMDASAWFVLLLSEVAARSPWVNREVEWWIAHKDASRILPVVTDGEFGWDGGDVAPSSTAAPPALSGAFAEEPRWVDLRWARSEEHLDLNDPRFSDAIADLASAIRGVPKDDLSSEEVRQHRRTVRTAWSAALALLVLATTATIGAAIAIDRSNEATAQHDAAEAARGEAEAAQAFAEAERDRANEEADRANTEADRANDEADRANRVSAHVVDRLVQGAAGVAPPSEGVVWGDRLSILDLHDRPPNTARLDFLQEYCEGTTCFRDAVMLFTNGQKTGAWHAYIPFHIRHGFVNDGSRLLPYDGFVSPGYDLRVFVTRREGPVMADGSFPIDQTFLFHVDYVVYEDSADCGTAFALGERTGVQPCEMFVHEFTDGLPPGRYDFWVEWRAPCRAWLGLVEACEGVTVPLDLVVSQVNLPFYGEGFGPSDDSFGNP